MSAGDAKDVEETPDALQSDVGPLIIIGIGPAANYYAGMQQVREV